MNLKYSSQKNKDGRITDGAAPYRLLIISCVIFSLIVALCVVINMSGVFSLSPKYSIKLTDWNYTSSDKLADLSTGTPDYRHSDSDNRVSKEYSENYILLSGSFNIPEEYDSLMVRTVNNKLRIKANGDVLLDSLGIEGMFTGNKANYVNLPGDGNRDVDIEIILYTPFSYNADIYLINSVYLDENIPAGILYDIIAGVIFAIASIIIFLAALFLIRDKSRKRPVYTVSAVCLSMAVSLIINQGGFYIKSLSSPVMFKLDLFLKIVVCTLFLFSFLTFRNIWNKAAEAAVGIGVAYALCVFLCPVDIITVILIKAAGFLILASVIYVIVMIFIKPAVGFYERLVTVLYLCGMLLMSFQWLNYLSAQCYNFGYAVLILILSYSFAVVFACGRGFGTTKEFAAERSDVHTQGLHFGSLYDDKRLLNSLLAIWDEKCNGHNNHLISVAEYARLILIKSGMSENEADYYSRASMLHDIGKLVIPKKTLMKEDGLTPYEMEQIRCHVLYGYNILSGSDDDFIKTAAEIARQHHERYDGSGYLGLKGSEISYPSSVVAISDVFDALTEERSYKKAWAADKAFEYILEHSGTFFNPEAVEIFRSCKNDIMVIYNKMRERDSDV